MKICSICIMDESVKSIKFNKKGVCQFCKMHDEMEREYPLNAKTKIKLHNIVKKIKIKGKNSRYDCVCGVSGGRDSSYTLYYIKEILGLRPLAVHYDNGFNTQTSVNNLYNICHKLNIDLETEVENWDNFKEILKALFYSSVPDIDIATDIGIFKTMYKNAAKENISYVINGHSFRTEGIDPLVWTYMDPLYLKNLSKKNSKINLKIFNNFFLSDLIYYKFIKRIKTFLPLNYIDYDNKKVEQLLSRKFDWKFYKEHHYESSFTKFVVGYYLPKKFNIDRRKTDLSAMIRSKKILRENALKIISKPSVFENKKDTINYIFDKIGFSENDFERILNNENKDYRDFITYFKYFKYFKFVAYILMKLDLIPKILYLKFYGQ